MIGDYKEVFFDIYCEACKHYSKPETVDPCCECLDNPAMVDSHKPMHFEKKDDGDKREKGKHGCPCKCS